MALIKGFEPIVDSRAKLLILGSMPSVASLTARQYYGHSRNSFWKIMADLLKFDAEYAYDDKVEILKSAGIAVWDVINTCYRPGSADAMIDKNSVEVNDFSNFFNTFKQIRQVFFNGTLAEQSFKNYVLSHQQVPALTYARLPSTSPANASMSYIKKLENWQVILTTLTTR